MSAKIGPVGHSKTGRKQDGRFAPGQSGNPAGRPKGSRNKMTALCADLLGADGEEIIREVVRRAKKGDGVAMRLCVERLVPVRAARDRAVELGDVPAATVARDIVTAAAAVIQHAAAGDITLSEAREFLALLDVQRRAIETADLVVRLEALEGGAGQHPPIGFVSPAGGDDPNADIAARVRRLESE